MLTVRDCRCAHVYCHDLPPCSPKYHASAPQTWVDQRSGTSVYRTVPCFSPSFPGVTEKVDFAVDWEAVSLHLPLHRFFCKVRRWG